MNVLRSISLLFGFVVLTSLTPALFGDDKIAEVASKQEAQEADEQSEPTTPSDSKQTDSKKTEQVESKERWVTSLTPLGGGELMAATADGLLLRPASVVTFSAGKTEELAKRYSHEASVWAVAAADDGSTAASIDYRGNLAVFDRIHGEAKVFKNAGRRWSRSLCYSLDNKQLLIGNESGQLIVWSLEDSKIEMEKELVSSAILSMLSTSIRETPIWLMADSSGGVHAYDAQWNSLGSSSIGDDAAMSMAMYRGDLLVGGADRKVHRFKMSGADDDEGKFSVAFDRQPAVYSGSDWITAICAVDDIVYAADLRGQVAMLRLGGVDTVQLPSGVWDLVSDGDRVLAGTRKHGVVEVKRP